MYSRNRIYITDSEQERIRQIKILIAGCGLGSNIAEYALRLGFENLCIIDGDKVELSNLNRQNYTFRDIGKFKAEVLHKRLLEINPHANILSYTNYITPENIDTVQMQQYDVAINTLDFSSEIPFLFDKVCLISHIPVIHPYNFGWAGLVFVIDEGSGQLESVLENHTDIETQIASYILKGLKRRGIKIGWLEEALDKYSKENNKFSPPQLSVGSSIIAGACTNLLYSISTNKPVKKFPDFYILSLLYP